MLAASKPWQRRYEGGTLQNLHHDRNEGPGRVATVLIYLTDVPSGGETLFPCAGPAARRTRELDAVCGRLAGAYGAGERILWPAFYSDSFDVPAFQRVDTACPQGDGGGGGAGGKGGAGGDAQADGMLLFRPRKGSALLFWSAPMGNASAAHPHMWHGGCRVWRGEKWTLQKFKEMRRTG